MHQFFRCWIFLGLCFACASVSAESYVAICYNWGCQKKAAVRYPDAWLKQTLVPLRQAKTAVEERAAVAEVVRKLYVKAAEQTPIAADEPGNEEDETVLGRMDCIDHSTTTANMLSLLQFKKSLRWHQVGPYAHRTRFLDSHYSATLVEIDTKSDDDSQIFTVDPWLEAHGELPTVLPVREWGAYRFYSLETQHHTTSAAPLAGR